MTLSSARVSIQGVINRAAILTSSESGRQLLAGVLANAAGKGWVLLLQVISIPTLSSAWGADGYGKWLMLSTVPSYLALSGLGFGGAAATEMTRHIAVGDQKAALTSFQSVWAMITGILILIVGMAAALWALSNAFGFLTSPQMREMKLSGLIFVVYSAVVVQTSLIYSGYSSTSRYAEGTMYMGLVGLAEGVGAIVTALLGGHLVAAALSLLSVRVAGHTLFYARLRTTTSWLRTGLGHASMGAIRELARPATASLGLAASNALALQGVVLSIGFFLSPAAVSVFGATRTICRVPFQISDLLGRATLPELTRSYARGDMRKFSAITLLNTASAAVIALPLFLVLGFFGTRIGFSLSHGKIHFDRAILMFLLLATAAQLLWVALSYSFTSRNRHHAIAYPYIGLSLLATISPPLLAHFGLGLRAVCATLSGLETVMLLHCISALRREAPAAKPAGRTNADHL